MRKLAIVFLFLLFKPKFNLQQLKSQRDKMKQYIRRNEKQMEREKELAKQLVKTNKKE